MSIFTANRVKCRSCKQHYWVEVGHECTTPVTPKAVRKLSKKSK